ncbi:MAG: hypothetical protein QF790_03865 [Gammaproteobacteria bacterium]|jgi:hypothetical protein|nr:hypothetical protein [Gammaproteobacteria bacterium]MDP6616287.1 hypothetical protein [Gammaproteobacteria bacterium]MDP6694001.1 hypothetical protein [Gammaproteobacteria bacterium]MDP7041073.1 hypothetical protein [Gammaproteobacteria bacterium]
MYNYSDAVAEYFLRPPLAGGSELRGEAGSLARGTWVCVSADTQDGNLHNMGFRAFACPHIIAACNWVMERLEGCPVGALCEVEPEALQTRFDIPVEKAGKLLILKDALLACYEDYQQRAERRSAS